MTNSNIQLDHNLHRRFVDALLQLPVTETFEGRSSLLEGLPRIDLNRSQNNSRLDLNQIISGFVRLGRDTTTGIKPLIVIAENAMQYIQGWEGKLSNTFKEIIQELKLYYGSEIPAPSAPDEGKVTQQPTIMTYDISIIRQLIEQALSAENLDDLCFYYFRPVYDSFTNGQTVSYRRLQLLEYADRHREIPKLLTVIQKYNPTLYQEYAPKLGIFLELDTDSET